MSTFQIIQYDPIIGLLAAILLLGFVSIPSTVAIFSIYKREMNYIERCAESRKVSGIEKIVCDDITERQALGIAKYGKTVADNQLSLREWLQHAYEECLDQSIYLRRAIAELDRKAPSSEEKSK